MSNHYACFDKLDKNIHVVLQQYKIVFWILAFVMCVIIS